MFFLGGKPMPLLRMEEITKAFPGVVANDRVSFSLEQGEVHALVGENGAGKTTLMKILYGLYRQDAGTIYIEDEPAQIRNPSDAIRLGIGMVHQHFMLIPPFTVLENIVLGSESHRAGILRMDEPERKIARLAEDNGIEIEPSARIEELSVGQQQQVEILKILYRGAEILVFDEPTAVLTPQESEELFRTFRMLTAQGKGIIFISHKLDEVLEVSDRITVIRRGTVVKTLERKEANKALIAELMVGKPVLLQVENPPAEPGAPVLKVRDLTMKNEHGVTLLDRISLEVRAGEIYGIAGVEGNGQSELVSVIADRHQIVSGEVLLEDRQITEWDVRKRREAGISHIPEDRQRYGLLLGFPLAENLALGRLHRPPFVNRFQMLQSGKIRGNARTLIEEYDIRTPSEQVPAHALSGGNQQKAIIARELSAHPVLILASQPTRGVDIGATEFIYRRLIEAKKSGIAVLLVSADLDEVLSISDRIGVMYKGKIIREFGRGEATKEQVGFYMMGERTE